MSAAPLAVAVELRLAGVVPETEEERREVGALHNSILRAVDERQRSFNERVRQAEGSLPRFRAVPYSECGHPERWHDLAPCLEEISPSSPEYHAWQATVNAAHAERDAFRGAAAQFLQGPFARDGNPYAWGVSSVGLTLPAEFEDSDLGRLLFELHARR